MTRSSEWLSKRIYLLAASLYFLACVLRTWLFYRSGVDLERALVLLSIWLLLFVTEPMLSEQWKGYFPFYLTAQTVIVLSLLAFPDRPDFVATLLGILSMQVMLRYSVWVSVAWIVFCTGGMIWILWSDYQNEAIALTLIYTAANVFLGSYMRLIRRAEQARLRNQALAGELEQANRQLLDYSTQLERLSAVHERNRLARELHDSVTQTAFSMNLATQSAALLLQRDPSRVNEQLERLYTLARGAMAEMQELIDKLKPEPAGGEGLGADLKRLAADPRYRGHLDVTVSVEGSGDLQPAEQSALLRIAQEALNNILKHARTNQATIRLGLGGDPWMEIEDRGQGFNPMQAQGMNRLGLTGMNERAAEIGWAFQIESSTGAGTRIRVEKT